MSRRTLAAAGAVIVCDVLAYLLLMDALGLRRAGILVGLAATLRGVILPTAVLAAVAALPNRRLRVAVMASLTVLFAVALGGQIVYAAYFQAPPTPETLRHLGEIPEVLPQVVHQLLGWRVPALVSLLVVGFSVWQRRLADVELPWRRAAAVVAAALLVSSFQLFSGRAAYDRFGPVPSARLRVYGLGDAALRFGLVDLWAADLAAAIDRRRHPMAADWPGPVAPDPRGSRVRTATGWNLLMVQLESVDPWAVAAEVRGEPVMPTMRALGQRGLVFGSLFAQHSGGGSVDAELAAMLSVLPLATHSGLSTMDAARIVPLPRVLAGHGYTTAALHPNRGSYFNRALVYPRLGFERFFAFDDFAPPARGWNAEDAAFFVQAVDRLAGLPEPFFGLLISMQSHGPFRNHSGHPEVDPGPDRPRLERDYLQCMREIDRAVAALVERLDRTGLARRTVVLLFSDHASQVRDDRVFGREPIVGIAVLPGGAVAQIPRLGSHLDLAPTALELLGLPQPDGWIGTSLLAPGDGVVVFNDLAELSRVDGDLRLRRAGERMPWLVYSAAVLGG